MALVEDYNYRSLNRSDLMSLSSINDNDMRIKKFKKLDTKRDWSINLYNMDIPGSSPRKYGSLVNKVDFVNKIDDIEKSSSRQLHFKLNRPEFNLHNNDIDGSKPQCVKFKTERGQFNPLEPKYKLSKYEELEPIKLRYIRDNIKIDDIDGAHPKRYFKWLSSSVIKHDEIDGSKPKKPKIRKADYNSYNYSDVTNFKFVSNRNINPLDPEYVLDYGKGEKYFHGKIKGSKPLTFLPMVYPDPFNLKTSDVPGAQLGSKNKFNKFSSLNHNLILSDIENAHSGSLKKGIKTDRETNPLDPCYTLPGHLEAPQNQNPYGNTLHSKARPKTLNDTPGELAIKERLERIKNNTMNNPINGKDEKNKEKRTHIDPKESIKLDEKEIVGFNNQIFQEEKQLFDPEKFKKPDPYHGYIHEQYIISSDNQIPRKFEEKKKSPANLEGKEKTKNNKVGYSAFDKNSNSNYKQTNAQKLDKFIGSV